jgi:hypothetical protein
VGHLDEPGLAQHRQPIRSWQGRHRQPRIQFSFERT